jgi:hypothetical protein
MKKIQFAPVLLAFAVLTVGAASVAAQAVPDNIPDLPGESPADRAQERMKERYRGVLSRFYTIGYADLAPINANGFAYGADFQFGYQFRSGDALFLTTATRSLPFERDDRGLPEGRATLLMLGGGFDISGTRVFGDSPAAQRAGLGVGVSAVWADVRSTAFDLHPTYAVLQGRSWSLPVGVKLSYAFFHGPDAHLSKPFVGITLGVKHRFGQRERMELR